MKLLRSKLTLTLFVGILWTLFFSSCGSDNQEKSSNKAATKIDFHIDWSPGPDYIGFFVSDELGYYAEEGLQVKIKSGSGAEQAAKLIKSNAIKIGTTTVDALIRQELALENEDGQKKGKIPYQSRISKKNTPKIAAIVFVTNPVVLVTQKDIPINKIEDLEKLKKIGYSQKTSVTYTQFMSLLSKYPELKVNEEKLLEKVGWNGPQEFQNGNVDGVLAYATDVPPELKSQGIAFNIKRLAYFGLKIPGQCIAVAPNAEISQDSLQRFLRASVRGWEYARENPKSAADIFVARFPGQNREKALTAINYTMELLPPVLGGRAIPAYTSPERIRDQVKSAIGIVADVVGITVTEKNTQEIVYRMVP